MKNIMKIVSFIIISISILISVIIFFYASHEGYELLFLQPLVYMIAYSLVLRKTLNHNRIRIFFVVLILVSFIRYVLLPLMIVLSDHYGGRSFIEPNEESFLMAILLMNYELIVCSLFIAYKESKLKIRTVQNTPFIRLKGSDIGYILFGMFTIVGVVLYPLSLNSLNFIFPSSLEIEYENSLIENLVIYSVIISKQLLFILITRKLYSKYIKTGNSLYVLVNFLMGFLNIFIYFGTNRTDIIISAMVTFLVLSKLYSKSAKKYMIAGTLIIVLIVSIVTEARQHSGFSRDANNKLVDSTDTFQIYTGGVYNVAIAIETSEDIPEEAYTGMLFFDIFRPMIGVNIFIKDLPFQYSNIYFNKRMWIGSDRRSQILPMIGQGNIYFGFFFAPIFALLFINLFYFLERKANNSNNLEIYYFLNLVMARLGFFMGQNTMNLINDLSMNLVLFFIVYYFNKYIKQIVLKN